MAITVPFIGYLPLPCFITGGYMPLKPPSFHPRWTIRRKFVSQIMDRRSIDHHLFTINEPLY